MTGILMSPRERVERELQEIERYEVSGVHMPNHVDLHGNCTHDSIVPEPLEIVYQDEKLVHKSVWTCRYCGYTDTSYAQVFMHSYYNFMLGQPPENWNALVIPQEVTDFIARLGEDWKVQLCMKSVEWIKRRVIPTPPNRHFQLLMEEAAKSYRLCEELRQIQEENLRKMEEEDRQEVEKEKLKDGFFAWLKVLMN